MPACARLSLKVVVLVWLTACGTLVNAQTFVSGLFPRLELREPALQPGTLAQDQSSNLGLHIEVLSGDGAINVIKTKAAVKPVVEVRDRNNLPVEGAAVIFTAPSGGPSVVFVNGSRSVTVMTDSVGRATAVGLKPVSPGTFQINVSASFHSQIATASISMTNALTAAAAAGLGGRPAKGARKRGLSTGALIALVAVAGGAAVGIGVGLGHHGSSSATTSSPTTVTIGVGTGGTVAGPHLTRAWNSRRF